MFVIVDHCSVDHALESRRLFCLNTAIEIMDAFDIRIMFDDVRNILCFLWLTIDW